MSEIFKLADNLKELTERKKLLEEEVKGVNLDIKNINEKLSDLMITEELQNFNRNGTLFCLTTRAFISAKADQKEQLILALKNNDYADIVKESVHPQTLSSFAKELMEENEDELPAWLKPYVNCYEETKVGMRKSK